LDLKEGELVVSNKGITIIIQSTHIELFALANAPILKELQ
jgi:hypothetical protein